MISEWGEVFYRAAAVIAGLIVLLIFASCFPQAGDGKAVIDIAPLVLAATIWLIGRSCRYMLAGR